MAKHGPLFARFIGKLELPEVKHLLHAQAECVRVVRYARVVSDWLKWRQLEKCTLWGSEAYLRRSFQLDGLLGEDLAANCLWESGAEFTYLLGSRSCYILTPQVSGYGNYYPLRSCVAFAFSGIKFILKESRDNKEVIMSTVLLFPWSKVFKDKITHSNILYLDRCCHNFPSLVALGPARTFSGPPVLCGLDTGNHKGLSYDTNESVLKDAFGRHGELIEVKVICDRKSGKSKGFGFVQFTTESSAGKALQEMDGQLLDGRNIRVDYAKKDDWKSHVEWKGIG
ncbi:hypothetical protein IFM89_033678 [Coptis chinensis]|uniref:RRM domain-containing protein n=1 Tax=Coptis chinensis TaxID=261450 RepID=A0A835HG19_9MAGN|nr:hypothetical protein IFM89_033678 [Coptis chinensis]